MSQTDRLLFNSVRVTVHRSATEAIPSHIVHCCGSMQLPSAADHLRFEILASA